jgi:hypothetical protein
VEGEGEPTDEEFQESEILNEEFEHEDVKDPLQGFVDLDSPPTYVDDVNEEDPIERSLSFNLEEEYEEDGSSPIFDRLYPKEDDPLEEEEPMNDVAEYYEEDEYILGELHNFSDEELGYVDFFGVDYILFDSHNNNCDEFYTDEENYMFTRETTADPFLSIFMARGREKKREKYGKPKALPSGVWGLHENHQGISMMKSITFIVGCCLVLILRNGEWNELTGHPKDRGNDNPN